MSRAIRPVTQKFGPPLPFALKSEELLALLEVLANRAGSQTSTQNLSDSTRLTIDNGQAFLDLVKQVPVEPWVFVAEYRAFRAQDDDPVYMDNLGQVLQGLVSQSTVWANWLDGEALVLDVDLD